jgi:hypothetical protein
VLPSCLTRNAKLNQTAAMHTTDSANRLNNNYIKLESSHASKAKMMLAKLTNG